MAEFLCGLIVDITGLEPELDEKDSEKPIKRKHKSSLPWKFNGSLAIIDCSTSKEDGFNVLADVPIDCEEEDDSELDFLLEVSDTPHLESVQMRQSAQRGSFGEECSSSSSADRRKKQPFTCIRLDDVLKKMDLSRDQFVGKYSVEIECVSCEEFDAAAKSSLSTYRQYGIKSKNDLLSASIVATNELKTMEVVRLDDTVRDILGIECFRLR